MVNAYYNTRKTGPDEVTVTVIDFKPERPEPEVEPLRLGLVARDACGDGTDEFRHIEPLVTWQIFPVTVFLENSIPGSLRGAVIMSFEAFNIEAGFKLYELTDNLAVAKVRVNIDSIDVAGNTIARAQWSYRISTKEITRATITFDSNENWGALSNESCGRTGSIFDCANVGVHEFGHISGLSHAPTDQLQTMYASTSPGKTLGRTLGNGDKKGFKLAYRVVTPPTPEPPEPEPEPPIPEPEPPTPEPEPEPPTPEPPKPHEHKLTPLQKVNLKLAELQYINALKSGDENGIRIAKENLDNVRVEILVELHSGPVVIPPPPPPVDCGPDPDPNNEHVKPGGWGGDIAGATTWEAVVMRDDPSLWKVVDKAGTNIAHRFASEAEAVAYIKYHQCIQEGGDPDPTPGPEPEPEPEPTIGNYPYKAIGQPMQSTQRGPTTRHYRSGKPDDETIEKNVKNIRFKNYQFVSYVTMHEIEHSDTLSVKYGGTHMGSGWFDHGISFGDGKGQCCMGKEEDHPSTDLCVIKGPQLGEILEKKVGIAGIYYTDQNFCELWIDIGDGWKKQMEAKDVGGFNPGSDEDEAQLRIDGFKKGSVPTIHSSVVTEIAPKA